MLKPNRTLTHFHAGHNDAGYLPESDVETFDTFDDAKRYMISELLWAADNMASWAEDGHECDDCDSCPETLASEVTLAAEDLNLDSGPEWSVSLSDGRSLPVSWWINPCTETVCSPDPAEDTARRIASDWHGGQSSALYSFASTGHVAEDLWAEIRREVTDEDDRAYLLAFLGDEPTDDGSVSGWACTDCLMLVANGDTPPELDEDGTAEFVARFEARTAGYWVACGDDTDEFSWRQCDTCGSTLGGSRHAVTLFPAAR